MSILNANMILSFPCFKASKWSHIKSKLLQWLKNSYTIWLHCLPQPSLYYNAFLYTGLLLIHLSSHFLPGELCTNSPFGLRDLLLVCASQSQNTVINLSWVCPGLFCSLNWNSCVLGNLSILWTPGFSHPPQAPTDSSNFASQITTPMKSSLVAQLCRITQRLRISSFFSKISHICK